MIGRNAQAIADREKGRVPARQSLRMRVEDECLVHENFGG